MVQQTVLGHMAMWRVLTYSHTPTPSGPHASNKHWARRTPTDRVEGHVHPVQHQQGVEVARQRVAVAAQDEGAVAVQSHEVRLLQQGLVTRSQRVSSVHVLDDLQGVWEVGGGGEVGESGRPPHTSRTTLSPKSTAQNTNAN